MNKVNTSIISDKYKKLIFIMINFCFIVFLFILPFITPLFFKLYFFSLPACKISSLFFNLPCLDMIKEGGCWLIPHPRVNIQVTSECSGFRFFTIIYLITSLIAWQNTASKIAQLRQSIYLLVACYVITIFTNTFRIITLTHVEAYMNPLFPQKVAGILHSLPGAIIFLTMVIACFIMANKVYKNKTTCNKI